MEEILASIRKIISDDSEPVAEAATLPADAAKDAKSMIDDMFEDGDEPSQAEIDAIMAGNAGAADREEQEDTGDEQVLELTEDMVAEPMELVEGIDDGVDFGEAEHDEPPAKAARPEPTPEPAPRPKMPNPRPTVAAAVDEKLISRETEAAVSSAFSSLAGMMLSSNGNARTLEDLVSEMLRPMLKTWLDDNLPGLVEEIVRSEIERVTRGNR